MYLSFFKQWIDYGTAALGSSSLPNLEFIDYGTAVAVLQHPRTSLFNSHCGTAGARNFCRSKWAGYSAVAPH